MKLYITYSVENKKYKQIIDIKYSKETDFVFSNNFIEINSHKHSNSIKIELIAKQKLILSDFKTEISAVFSAKDKIFANGFQSWTDTKEFLISEKIHKINPLAKLLNPIFKFSQYGDYTIFSPTKNSIHAFSYAYIRKKDEFHLYFSNDETNGYTIFEFFPSKNKIVVHKDCLGKEVTQKYTLLDINTSKHKGEIIDIFPSNKKNIRAKNPVSGWTSWYNYYQNISEKIILENLEAFSKHFPQKSIFQIDDGYQEYVGDWLNIDKQKFPEGLYPITEKIHSQGYLAGLWLAPFAAEKKSIIAQNHPDWILKNEKGEKIFGGSNWSGFYALDFYNSEFRYYLKKVFDKIFNIWNFDLVKLDFLYAAAIIPQKGKSRGEIMHEAMKFLREIAGEKLILACGVPIAAAAENTDYCRIGADISLDWNGKSFEKLIHRERVSTLNSLKNTIYRKIFDGKLFFNDPDVFLLRDQNIKLSKTQKETIFIINSIFGSLVFTSDNINFYTENKLKLLKNLQFFIKAEIINFIEKKSVIEFNFIIENKKYIGFSNFNSSKKNIENNISQQLNIYTLELEKNYTPNEIKAFETKIFAEI